MPADAFFRDWKALTVEGRFCGMVVAAQLTQDGLEVGGAYYVFPDLTGGDRNRDGLKPEVACIDPANGKLHSKFAWRDDEYIQAIGTSPVVIPEKNRAFITTAHRGQNSPIDPQLTTPGVGRADVWVFDAATNSPSPLNKI